MCWSPEWVSPVHFLLLLVLELSVHADLHSGLLLPDDTAVANLYSLLTLVVAILQGNWIKFESLLRRMNTFPPRGTSLRHCADIRCKVSYSQLKIYYNINKRKFTIIDRIFEDNISQTSYPP